ncbi:DUF418 domain-containing protein [Streptomyces sp. NPDC005955]|uniref:DUF418 domain-containing protein n=1 Tax=Streptomyces sp. NPDC005955 TaxID=3364738 RepID=UPI0036AEDE6E
MTDVHDGTSVTGARHPRTHASPGAGSEADAGAGAGTTAVRLLNVDALRGFALFGILIVNIWAFADPYYADTTSNPTYDSGLDHAVRFTMSLLFETKFYLLFSFLFGYSFTLQMGAAERAGASFRPRMLRRQAGLLVLGLLHGALLYYAEILALYSLLGLILLACRSTAPARAVKVALALLVTISVGWLLLGLAVLADGGSDAPADSEAADKLAAFGGDAAATAGFHSGHLAETFVILVLVQGANALAMFFLGYAAGRRQLFARPEQYRTLLRRTLLIGGPIGLAGAVFYATSAVYAQGSAGEILAFGVGQLTAPLLTASYVVLGLALFRTRPGGAVQRALAPLGKTALTNYLLQSATLGVLFTGYGFGLVDRLSPLTVVAVVPLIYMAQLLLSHWWLRTHRYGPAEWALRAVTVWRIPTWTAKR